MPPVLLDRRFYLRGRVADSLHFRGEMPGAIGPLCPTYTSPFDLFVKGNETGDWLAIRDDFRTWVMANRA